MVLTSRKFNGRRLKWRDLVDNPHGLILGPREFGQFRKELPTADNRIHVAPPEFVECTRQLLAEAKRTGAQKYPLLMGNQRHRHSMNSWLNELPGLHPAGKGNNAVLNLDDAAALSIATGDAVRTTSEIGEIERTATVSDRVRAGGRGHRPWLGLAGVRSPGEAQPESLGVNRNLLVGNDIDPLSQTTALHSTYVRIDRIET